MPLKAGARGWLDAASGGALDALRNDVVTLADHIALLSNEVIAIGERAEHDRNALGETARGEADILRHELAEARSETGEVRETLEAVRGEIAALRDAIDEHRQRFDDHAAQAFARVEDLAALQEQIDRGGASGEEMRVKLSGLAAQLKWEGEDLRKALAAIAARTARSDAHGE